MKQESKKWQKVFKKYLFWFGIVIVGIFLLSSITSFVIYRDVLTFVISFVISIAFGFVWFFVYKKVFRD